MAKEAITGYLEALASKRRTHPRDRRPSLD